MCGILGYISVKENTTSIETFYKRLQFFFKDLQREGGSYNNIDATGYWHPYIGVGKGNYKAEDAIKLPEFEEIKNHPVPQIFLGHVRKTTEGHPENNENNHPLWSDNYILIHNGGVDSDILDTDIKTKYHMPGTVDSNHILACLEEYGIDDFRSHLKGLAAIIFIKRDEENTLYIYRDTRPMFIMRLGHSIWISSTKQSLLNAAKIGERKKTDIFFKEQYPMKELETGQMFKIQVLNGSFIYKEYPKVTLPAKATTYQSNNYSGYNNRYNEYNNHNTHNNANSSPISTYKTPLANFSLSITKSFSPRICSFCGNFTELSKTKVETNLRTSCEICYTSSKDLYTGDGTIVKGSCFTPANFTDPEKDIKIEDELRLEMKISPIISISLYNGFSFIINKNKGVLIISNNHIAKTEAGQYTVSKGTGNAYSTTYLQTFPEGSNFWVTSNCEFFKVYKNRPYVEVTLTEQDYDYPHRMVSIIRTILKEFEFSFKVNYY